MKHLVVILLLLLGITEVDGQGVPCAFDMIRKYNPFWNSSSDFFLQELTKWRATGQIPHELANPESSL